MLFLLQYGKQHLLTHLAGTPRFLDDRGCAFLRRPLVLVAQIVGLLRLRVEPHRGDGPALGFQEGLDFGLAHGVAVEELAV